MTQTIEQLTARVRELEEEKKELQALLDFDNARLDQIEDELEDVEYLGPYVEGIKVLKTKLAAAQEEIESNKAYFTTLLEEQRVLLAKTEQRVAEAIVDMLQQKHRNCLGAHSFYLAASVATANGEWRKFVKEGE